MPAGYMFKLHTGDTFVLMFRLRRKGRRAPYPVNTATAITLNLRRQDGTALAPVAADKLHPDADWTNGVVPVQVDRTETTLRPDTLRGLLMVSIGTEGFGLPHDGEVVVEVE